MTYIDYETCGACGEQFPYGSGHECPPRVTRRATRYFVAEDGDREPTLWRGNEDDAFPEAILRRCDLPPQGRHLWPLIVEAALNGAELADAWRAGHRAALDGVFPLRPEDCPYPRVDPGPGLRECCWNGSHPGLPCPGEAS